MKKIITGIAIILSATTVHAQHFDIDTLSMTGRIDQRINMVFLSDGYRQDELGKFITDVQWMMDALFAKSPYSRYRDYFNCFAIKVPSEVSGAANDPDSLINNYFGSTFNYADIWRLVVPTRTDRINRVLADNFPAYDQIFMIVNDARYGGSGGWIATSTVHPDGPEICIHELGHSFAGLSDEYWVGPGYARENSNMTQESDPEKVKWKRWLGYNATGIYPHQESPTWYRPHQNCEMRFLNSTFCPVCKEETVSTILDMTNPVLEYVPDTGNLRWISDTLFKVTLMAPVPNTLKTWWELNRNVIATQQDSVRLSTGSVSPGQNTLTCNILDTTYLIRNSSHPSIHLNKVTWNIDYKPSGIDFKVSENKINLSVFPNPASGTINLTYRSGQPCKGELRVRLFDISGKPVTRTTSFPLTGTGNQFQIPLPAGRLASGLYYLQAQTAGDQFSIPVIIGR